MPTYREVSTRVSNNY